VYLLFLDESGKPHDATFAVGGVAIRADEWELMRQRWEPTVSDHSWPTDKELKWHGTKTGEVPPALVDAVYAALAEAPITCFVTVLRPLAGKQADPELFASAQDTYATALTFLAERFQRFLSRQDSHGVIILDSRRREVDDRMRRFFDRLQREAPPSRIWIESSTACCSGLPISRSGFRSLTWLSGPRWRHNAPQAMQAGG